MDLDDLGERLDRLRERIVVEVGRAVRADERGQLVTDAARVELGGVAPDEAARLEPLHAIVDGRRLEVHQGAELGVGRAGVALKGGEQAQVDPVEFRVSGPGLPVPGLHRFGLYDHRPMISSAGGAFPRIGTVGRCASPDYSLASPSRSRWGLAPGWGVPGTTPGGPRRRSGSRSPPIRSRSTRSSHTSTRTASNSKSRAWC